MVSGKQPNCLFWVCYDIPALLPGSGFLNIPVDNLRRSSTRWSQLPSFVSLPYLGKLGAIIYVGVGADYLPVYFQGALLQSPVRSGISVFGSAFTIAPGAISEAFHRQ